MKKFFVIALIAVFGTALFFACEKEDKNVNTNSCSSVLPYDEETISYEDYISILEQSTGINIKQLSQLPEIEKFANKKRDLIDHLSQYCPEKAEITSEDLQKIHYYNSIIQNAYNNGNENTAWIYLDSLCRVCVLLDNFMIEEDLDDYYIPSSDLNIQIPATQIKNDIAYCSAIKESISQIEPSFNNLTENEKDAVVAAALYSNISNKLSKEGQGLSCEQKARAKFVANVAIATVAYTVAAAGCSGSNFFVLICEGAAFAAYMDAVSTQKELLDLRLKNC